MKAPTVDGDATLTRCTPTAWTRGPDPIAYRAKVWSLPTRVHANVGSFLLLCAALLLLVSPSRAERYFEWAAYVGDAVHGVSSAGQKYYSFEESLIALRGALYQGNALWKHAEQFSDPYVIVNPYFPMDGYQWWWDSTMVSPSVDSVCSTGISAMCGAGGCSYTGSKMPYLTTNYVDSWQCQYQEPNPGAPPPYIYMWTPRVYPHCSEPGYGWSDYGGWVADPHGSGAPPAVCWSRASGHIYPSNFDPGKCNDCNSLGNPVNPALGTKTHRETVYTAGATPASLKFEWLYSTNMYKTVVKTAGWSHTFSRAIGRMPNGFPFAYRENGFIAKFKLSGGVYTPDADTADRLTRETDASGNTIGWTYYVATSEDTETYDAKGKLLAIQNRAGATLQLTYSDGNTPVGIAPIPDQLIRVTDPMGRQLNFTYSSAGQLATLTDPANAIYRFAYDSIGNLSTIKSPDGMTRQYLYENTVYTSAMTGIVDENGQRFSTYSYDTHGRATGSQHAGGIDNFSFTFNPNDSSTVIDPLGTSRIFTFSTVLGAVKPGGISQPCPACSNNSSATTYDANGNVTSRADFNGKQVCYAYDTTRNLETARLEGALASETCTTVLASPPSRPDVRRVTTTWNANWRLPATITEPAAGGTKTTSFTYDAFGNLTQKSIVAPRNDSSGGTLTRTWNWSYGTLGRVATATDPNGRVTSYSYYADDDVTPGKRGNLQAITNPLGHVTQFTAYDGNARPLTIVDPNGLTTALTYDARGRLINRNVGGEQTTYTYDGVGQLTLVTMPDFSTLAYAYDAAHRLTQIQDGLGNRIVYTLDAIGNRTREQVFDSNNVLARTRSRAYDTLNRLAQEIGAQAQTTTYGYDGNGNATSVSDPLSHTTGNSYDALNRLVQVLDPASGVTRYAYDGANNLSQVTDPRGLATVYTYDGLGNLTKQVSPDAGITTSTFDPAGNLLTKIDARGVNASYSVDALNRVVSVVYSKSDAASETQTYTYDSGANAKGRLTKLVDSAAITMWTYTAQGRVASKAQTMGGVTHALTYGYNGSGQLASLTTPSGQVIGYGYANNRVASVTVNGTALATGISVFPFGQAEGWQWGNAEYTFRRFDTDGRLASWEFRNGTSVLRNDLSFDTAGRITAVADRNLPALSGAYQYDAVDRLTVAQQGDPVTHTQQFSYDAMGNRQNATIDGSLANLYYATGSNQLQQMIGFVSPGYLGGTTALTYIYNNANRMLQVQSGGVTLSTYAVNGLGQRVQKVVGVATTQFVYDEQGRLLGEYDGLGKLIEETVWLDDMPIATLRPTGVAGTPTPINVYYVHADHLGSPRAVTRPSDNAIMWRWDNIDPFGANVPNESPSGLETFQYGLRFPGQYYDAETGTNYNYFRDYDPGIGRYERVDPIGIWGGLEHIRLCCCRPFAARLDPQWPRHHGNWCGSQAVAGGRIRRRCRPSCKNHDECCDSVHYANCEESTVGTGGSASRTEKYRLRQRSVCMSCEIQRRSGSERRGMDDRWSVLQVHESSQLLLPQSNGPLVRQ